MVDPGRNSKAIPAGIPRAGIWDSGKLLPAGIPRKGEIPGHIPGFSGIQGSRRWEFHRAAGKGEGIEVEKWEFRPGYWERNPGEGGESLARGIPGVFQGFSMDLPSLEAPQDPGNVPAHGLGPRRSRHSRPGTGQFQESRERRELGEGRSQPSLPNSRRGSEREPGIPAEKPDRGQAGPNPKPPGMGRGTIPE